MLTTRGFWFFLLTLVLVGAALVTGITTLGVLGLTLLLWFLWEWLVFALRVHALVRHLNVTRQVRDAKGPVASLWAGQPFEVQVRLWLESGLALPFVKVTDRVPFGVEKLRGDTERDGPVSREQALEIAYRLQYPNPGRLRFEGVGVQLADLQGFFYHATFLSRPQEYRVMPPLADARGHASGVKRHNLLPLLGLHRHPRPGSGSELLDLRDYIPGDPPKTIAWKPSARRDRLMTKVFESEVPVRCTLFVDTSNSVRVGPPGRNALARLSEISACVAQASAAARDLTGLCLFDEERTTYVRPARGGRHLIQLFNLLADAAGKPPSSGEARFRPLLRLAYGLAQELYPQQMAPDVNASPWWLPWLWPQPFYTVRRPTPADRFDRWLFRIWLGVWAGAFGVLIGLLEATFRGMPFTFGNLLVRLVYYLVVGVPLLAGFLLTLSLLRGYVLFLPSRRRIFHRRKRMAALLSARYGLAPGGLATLLEDDQLMNHYLQRFLADHHVPYPLPMYDRKGRYLYAAPAKVKVLASALLRAVGKGHDNELFVLLADLLELEDDLGPLLRAVKVARARHHRVMVVCPWPLRVPPPGEEPGREDGRHRRRRSPIPVQRLKETLIQTTTSRYHQAFHRLRRTFARLGVTVVCARGGEPARLILQRLEQLRLLEKKP
jgi:uncharacterized protein (DUF58 family)